MRIFEHNFVADKAKIRSRAVARQEFLTQSAAKFAEKTCAYACEDRFLYDFAVKMGKSDPEEYVINGGWKARSGGAEIDRSKNVAIEFKPCATDESSFNYELNKPISEQLYELFKPFGILNFDMGNKRIGEVYVLDFKTNEPLLKLQGRTGTNTLRITILKKPIAKRTNTNNQLTYRQILG